MRRVEETGERWRHVLSHATLTLWPADGTERGQWDGWLGHQRSSLITDDADGSGFRYCHATDATSGDTSWVRCEGAVNQDERINGVSGATGGRKIGS